MTAPGSPRADGSCRSRHSSSGIRRDLVALEICLVLVSGFGAGCILPIPPPLSGCADGDPDCGAPAVCAENFDDCDKRGDNGCEAHLMSDVDNCGRCGRACAFGTCSDGLCAPQVVADNQDGAFGLAVQGGRAYWATFRSGKVMSANTDGSGLQELASGYPTSAMLVIDAQDVFWIADTYNEASTGRLFKVSRSGGTVTTLAVNQTPRWGLPAVGDTYLYWGNWVTTADGTPPAVMRVRKAGGTPPEVFVADQRLPHSILNADGVLFWSNHGDGSVWFKYYTEAPRLVSANNGGPTKLATDGETVFWTNYYDGQVVRASRLGTGRRVLCENELMADNVAVDGPYVYWQSGDSEKPEGTFLKRMPKEGGAPPELIAQAPDICAIAFDDTAIYFTDRTRNAVYRVSK